MVVSDIAQLLDITAVFAIYLFSIDKCLGFALQWVFGRVVMGGILEKPLSPSNIRGCG